jgi:CHAT domain-containing protein
MAGFGTSIGQAGLSDLPAVPAELNEIVRTNDQDDGVVPGIVQLDQAFTRQALTDALGSQFRVIHIASHFVLGQRSAADSYLLLGNGEHLPLLDFRSDGNLTFANVDLVTLSACRTALEGIYGDGSEVDSMGTIVQDAGAPSVLASLWLVEDRSTAELMLRFYRHRVQDGLTTAEALRQAQIDLLTATAANRAGTTNYSHPYHWAPFILIGNTN